MLSTGTTFSSEVIVDALPGGNGSVIEPPVRVWLGTRCRALIPAHAAARLIPPLTRSFFLVEDRVGLRRSVEIAHCGFSLALSGLKGTDGRGEAGRLTPGDGRRRLAQSMGEGGGETAFEAQGSTPLSGSGSGLRPM